MYSLYGQPRNFKFMRKYQQYEPCFQTIFPFLMTMVKSIMVWLTLHENILIGMSLRSSIHLFLFLFYLKQLFFNDELRWMSFSFCYFNFQVKDNSLSFFFYIRIENRFPLRHLVNIAQRS